MTLCLTIEELGRVDQSVGITLSAAVGLAGTMIHRFGTSEQKERWLPSARRVARRSGRSHSPSPTQAPTPPRCAPPRASDAGEWVIDGTKAFITNSGTPITTFHVVAAATEPGGGPNGLSTIVVPADTPGVIVDRRYRKLGWHASDTHELTFEAAAFRRDTCSANAAVASPNASTILTGGRISIAALAVGLAQACLDASVAYAREREAFGRPIGANQGVQFKIADMRAKVETARLATYRAAWLKDQGRPHVAEASLAKLVSSEAAVDCARDAVQIHGGAGFIEESPVARFYRDAKVLEIGEGTSEMHRLILARDLGLPDTF